MPSVSFSPQVRVARTFAASDYDRTSIISLPMAPSDISDFKIYQRSMRDATLSLQRIFALKMECDQLLPSYPSISYGKFGGLKHQRQQPTSATTIVGSNQSGVAAR